MNIAIIIVTRNHRRDMQECLPSLAAQTRQDFTVVVSDNDSCDGTIDWIRREHPAVHVIENRANLGFAEGSNVGLRWALAAGAAVRRAAQSRHGRRFRDGSTNLSARPRATPRSAFASRRFTATRRARLR